MLLQSGGWRHELWLPPSSQPLRGSKGFSAAVILAHLGLQVLNFPLLDQLLPPLPPHQLPSLSHSFIHQTFIEHPVCAWLSGHRDNLSRGLKAYCRNSLPQPSLSPCLLFSGGCSLSEMPGSSILENSKLGAGETTGNLCNAKGARSPGTSRL